MNFQNHNLDIENFKVKKIHKKKCVNSKLFPSFSFLFYLGAFIIFGILIIFIGDCNKKIKELRKINALKEKELLQKAEEKSSFKFLVDSLLKQRDDIMQLNQALQNKEKDLNKQNEDLAIQFQTTALILDKKDIQIAKASKKLKEARKTKDKKNDLIDSLQKEERRKINEIKHLNSKINILRTRSEITSLSFDSKILSKEHIKVLKEWISQSLSLKLLYRSSRDGFTSESFHSKCDDSKIKNTLVVIKTDGNQIIGGFLHNNWKERGYIADEKAFIFNLSKPKKYKVILGKEAAYSEMGYLAVFGVGDIVIHQDRSFSLFPISYDNEPNRASSLELTNYKKEFQVEELEVFTVI